MFGAGSYSHRPEQSFQPPGIRPGRSEGKPPAGGSAGFRTVEQPAETRFHPSSAKTAVQMFRSHKIIALHTSIPLSDQDKQRALTGALLAFAIARHGLNDIRPVRNAETFSTGLRRFLANEWVLWYERRTATGWTCDLIRPALAWQDSNQLTT